MPETPFLRGRAALAGPRLSVFIQFIIRARPISTIGSFAKRVYPLGESPINTTTQRVYLTTFPPIIKCTRDSVQAPRADIIHPPPAHLNKGSHLPLYGYFNLLKAALFSSSSLSQCALLQTFALRQISGRLNMGLSSIFRAGKKAGPVVRHTISRMPARRGPKKTGGGSEDLR